MVKREHIITGSMSILLLLMPSLMNAESYYLPLYLLADRKHDATLISPSFQASKPVTPQKRVWDVTLHNELYTRSAHRAYGDTLSAQTTHNLSGLYFNQEDFRVSQAFEECFVPLDTQYYSPSLRILKMHPRITYTETGVALSAHFTVPVNDSGFFEIGIQGGLKEAEVLEKDDGGVDTRHDYDVEKHLMRYDTSEDNKTVKGVIEGTAYRLDYLESLPQLGSGECKPLLSFQKPVPTHSTEGIFIGKDQAAAKKKSGKNIVNFVFTRLPEGITPTHDQLVRSDSHTNTPSTKSVINGFLPSDLISGEEGLLYESENTNLYSSLSDVMVDTHTAEARADLQDIKAQYWVIPAYRKTTEACKLETNAESLINNDIPQAAGRYNENNEAWFQDRQYRLANHHVRGLADTRISLAYNAHTSRFISNSALRAELAFSLPTAQGEQQVHNPYHVHLGNRGHYEVSAALSGALQLCSAATIKAGGGYAYVLPEIEKRIAMPKGARIKNLGTPVQADVSWHNAHAHVTLYCGTTRSGALKGHLGYRFYYKGADAITYKTLEGPSWLGKKFNVATKTFSAPYMIHFDADNAARTTERCAHILAGGVTYQPTAAVTFSAEGSYTVAGKNMPQEAALSVSCIVRL